MRAESLLPVGRTRGPMGTLRVLTQTHSAHDTQAILKKNFGERMAKKNQLVNSLLRDVMILEQRVQDTKDAAKAAGVPEPEAGGDGDDSVNFSAHYTVRFRGGVSRLPRCHMFVSPLPQPVP